jgi:hypothetical protein
MRMVLQEPPALMYGKIQEVTPGKLPSVKMRTVGSSSKEVIPWPILFVDDANDSSKTIMRSAIEEL